MQEKEEGAREAGGAAGEVWRDTGNAVGEDAGEAQREQEARARGALLRARPFNCVPRRVPQRQGEGEEEGGE